MTLAASTNSSYFAIDATENSLKIGKNFANSNFVKNIHFVNNDLKKTILRNFIILLAPFAPHIAEEIWSSLGIKTSVHEQLWPSLDKKAIEKESYELVIQINGKVRDKLTIQSNTSEDEIKDNVLGRKTVTKWVENKTIKKIILVKGRIINIVI